MSFVIIFPFLLFLASLCTVSQIFWGSLKMKDLREVRADMVVRMLSCLLYHRSSLQRGNNLGTTFELLKKMRQEFSEIRVEQITELPTGWLGKIHALYLGAKQAWGEILLFTDADIVMMPSTLSRAVVYFVDEELNHLSLIFRNVAQGGLLNAMVVDALGGLFLLLRPWNVRKRGNRAFIRKISVT